MTREEAVARIKDHIEIHRYHERNAVKIFEALDMAIKALEQPEPSEDAVSRKAVQYLLAHFVNEDKYNDACEGLKHLPSVTPKQAEPCEDAVSRKAAISAVPLGGHRLD